MTIGRVALAAALAATTLGACKGAGSPGADDHRTEAPGQNAGAPARTESGGEADSGSFTNIPASTNQDTVAAAGVAGSGTAAVGASSGSIYTTGSGTLHSGDPTDAAVSATLGALNGAERELSELGAQKATNAAVKQYAQRMAAAHAQGTPPSAPMPPSASDLVVPLREAHAKSLAMLRQMPAGPNFDRAFMQRQVESHGNALQTITRLETAAKESQLVDRLRRMRTEVERHRAEAERLRAQLPSAS
jgi:putative membrane protein